MALINDLMHRAHVTARLHGFWEYMPKWGEPGRDARHILSLLMLVSTELAEAAEEVRKGTLEKFGEELADVVIRVFDIAFALGVDLEAAILAKMEKNEQRTYLHGGKRA